MGRLLGVLEFGALCTVVQGDHRGPRLVQSLVWGFFLYINYKDVGMGIWFGF